MDILGYTGYAVLIFVAVTGTIYVRREAANVPLIIMTIFFLVASVILLIFGINKLHAWWLLPTGFVLDYVIVKMTTPFYPIALKDLRGVCGEWARVSIVSSLVILVASVFAYIVRIGISPEKIRNAQQFAIADAMDRLSGSKSAQLIQAAKENNLQVVQGLLANGADVNAKDIDGNTALGLAAYKGLTEVAHLLLEKGADVNAKTNKGVTTLMLAAGQNHVDITKILLARNADVNAKTYDNGQTALVTAATNGHGAIVTLLLENSAEINAKNKKGTTALLAAAYTGNIEVINILLEKGADVNASVENGATALWVASQNGHTAVVKLLLERDANVNAKTSNDLTALWTAKKHGHTEIAQLLEKAGAK